MQVTVEAVAAHQIPVAPLFDKPALLEHAPCYAWDWSATQVIVEEAGGRITTLAGAEPAPGSNLLVSNGRVHDTIVAALAKEETR